MANSDWLIQVPLSELVALQNMTSIVDSLRAENAQLRRELDGLRRVQCETMQVVGDLRREFRKLSSG